eukprot:11182305-Lingulodinium_polyedra.AAC.1
MSGRADLIGWSLWRRVVWHLGVQAIGNSACVCAITLSVDARLPSILGVRCSPMFVRSPVP